MDSVLRERPRGSFSADFRGLAVAGLAPAREGLRSERRKEPASESDISNIDTYENDIETKNKAKKKKTMRFVSVDYYEI